MDCVCEPGKRIGVKPVKIQSKLPLELWASCANSEKTYDIECNHIITDEASIFPRNPIRFYDDAPHFHLRLKHPNPHDSLNTDWAEVKLDKCFCPKES